MIKEVDGLQKIFKSKFISGHMPEAMMTFTTINTFYNNFYNEQEAIKLAKFLGKNGNNDTSTLIIISTHWRRIDGKLKELSENKYVPERS